MCFDNGQLLSISQRTDKNVTNSHLNKLVSNFMTGITSSFRFPCNLNNSMKKLATNMIPFPRIKFLTPASSFDKIGNIEQLTSDIFSARHVMTDTDPSQAINLTGYASFRGSISACEAEQSVSDFKMKNKEQFCYWVEDSFKVSTCTVSPVGN